MQTNIRLVAFDLDGTLTQHKTPLSAGAWALLDALGTRYRLLMVGAGACGRIHGQMRGYPIDIIGNYGMQSAAYDRETGRLVLTEDISVAVDRAHAAARIGALRKRFGYTDFAGDSVEFHPSGMITFPLLGTAADIADKIRFDPDRRIRKPLYPAVRDTFDDYTVFIGGSSSFDIVPRPYTKRYALQRYCAAHAIGADEIVYAGDDWGEGGNDEDVYRWGIRFIAVDDYTRAPEYLMPLLA